MLDAYIIEELKKKKRRRRQEQQRRPEMTIYDIEDIEPRQKSDQDSDDSRSLVIIDYGA